MTTTQKCPKCGAELAASSPEGLCPKCLMKVGLGSNAGMQASAASGGTPPPLEEIAKHFPQLDILEQLGQGGMGVVYKARQKTLDRLVALKVLPINGSRDPTFAERFAREARALAKLNHPNIVPLYEFGETSGFYYFIMEFVDGVNLRKMLSTQRIAPREALAIVPQICDALQYAHDEGVVHRDIKPENILLDRRGRVKIADFGLAKLLGRPAETVRLTQSQMAMGTPHYMAPEQIEKPLEVDHRADIYSLGVVFYEMLTGELPIGRFAPPSHKVQMDVRLDEVVLRTLEKEPNRRYQHASELKTQVETITGGTEKSSPSKQLPASGATKVIDPVKWPAILIILPGVITLFVGGINAICVLQRCSILGSWSEDWQINVLLLGHALFYFVVGLITVGGARNMRKHKSLLWAQTGCIFAVFPSSLIVFAGMVAAPVWGLVFWGLAVLIWFVGAAAGVWGLAVLNRPEVKSAFQEGKKNINTHGYKPLWYGLAFVAVYLALVFVIPRLFYSRQHAETETATSYREPNATVYDWSQLPDSVQLLGGVPVTIEGRSALKVVNTNDIPLKVQLLRINKPPVSGAFGETDWSLLRQQISKLSYAITGEIKYEQVQGSGYLEMLSYFPPLKPGMPEIRFFVRTLSVSGEKGQISGISSNWSGNMRKTIGSSNWTKFILPGGITNMASFPAKEISPPKPPTRLEINLFLPGRGTVYLGPIELVEREHFESIGVTDTGHDIGTGSGRADGN